jgi:hypothetical protein
MSVNKAVTHGGSATLLRIVPVPPQPFHASTELL